MWRHETVLPETSITELALSRSVVIVGSTAMSSLACNVLRAKKFNVNATVIATRHPEDFSHMPCHAVFQEIELVRELWQRQQVPNSSPLLLVLDVRLQSYIFQTWTMDLLLNHEHFRMELVLCIDFTLPYTMCNMDVCVHLAPNFETRQACDDSFFTGHIALVQWLNIRPGQTLHIFSTYKLQRYTRPACCVDWSHFRLIVWHAPSWSSLAQEIVNMIASHFEWLSKY